MHTNYQVSWTSVNNNNNNNNNNVLLSFIMCSSMPWTLSSWIHINLNTIFYTYVEDSPTKTIYIKHYMDTHNDCSRNWVLILVWVEILWEEEGFQFGFNRWQSWVVSKVLWEWIPNVGFKAREGAKAMRLAFVLSDFQHVGVRRRA